MVLSFARPIPFSRTEQTVPRWYQKSCWLLACSTKSEDRCFANQYITHGIFGQISFVGHILCPVCIPIPKPLNEA
ncbi:unnamed protein product [Mycena citricolor]|uniref:Uncharacterized protein n=1 Tax=Mycena citricolor TaxID=2018698 RepID=A0AAD2HYR9_9AGAR|nr:unnamed protein product [Mycena citricolor]